MRLPFLIAALAVGPWACDARIDAQPSQGPIASIGARSAQFTFPAESVTVFRWDVPDRAAYSGRADYYWEVRWEPAPGRMGEDPHALSLVVRWQSGGPRSGSLAALLAKRPVGVLTFCNNCGTPASVEVPDSAVTWSLKGARLVFDIRGATAVRRIFPNRPSSVTFARRRGQDVEATWQTSVHPPP